MSAATFLTADRRTRDLDALAGGEQVDVLVVGGGITGVGVALDAVTRGLSVALLEAHDLAHGTSRWSSKLAHGGLRYLAKGHVGVAWESARERATLIDVIAPHLVRALPQLTPWFGRSWEQLAVEAGLRAGDAMRALAGTSARRLPRTRRVAAAEARRLAPALRREGLRGGVLSWDGQLEDDARLVVALARTAAGHGARIVTRAEVTRLHSAGATARETRSDATFEVRARHVVNATGVWADRLVAGLTLRPSKGAHVVVHAERLGHPEAMVYVAVPGHFGRFVFAIPREDGLVLIGLTDDPFVGEIPDVPEVEPGEERFLLDTVSRALERPLTSADVAGRYAGLRPLLDTGGGATADMSRHHVVVEDDDTGAVTVVGGKLTTYRRMAQDTVDRIAARPGCVPARAAPGSCRSSARPDPANARRTGCHHAFGGASAPRPRSCSATPDCCGRW